MLVVFICWAMIAYLMLLASRSPAAQIALHMLHSHAANGGVRARVPGEHSAQMEALMSKHTEPDESTDPEADYWNAKLEAEG
jgi:hypothetical protein